MQRGKRAVPAPRQLTVVAGRGRVGPAGRDGEVTSEKLGVVSTQPWGEQKRW